MRLLQRETKYRVNFTTYIENAIKNCSPYLKFQPHKPKEKLLPHEIPSNPWKTAGSDIFMLNNKTYLCIVDCFRKFLVVNLIYGLSADSLIKIYIIIFAECSRQRKIMSDAGTNFVSERF